MKIGFLGAGRIVKKVAPTLARMEEAQCYAIAARSRERAEQAAREYGFARAYGSYEELVSDPQVELVYVATPNSHHYEHMLLALSHGKPVICEKPFTLNAAQAREIQAHARSRNLLAAEAIWTRYMPSRELLRRAVEGGAVGRVHTLSANLFYNTAHKERLTSLELGGGALLDVGVYTLNFALMAFVTDIRRMESAVQMHPSGVDAMDNITLFYEDGRTAMLSAGMCCRSDRKGILYGENGYIIVENINNPQSITLYSDRDEMIGQIPVPEQISGFEYEFRECVRAIQNHETQCPSMPLDETIRVMELMDRLRGQWGMVFPQER